MEPPSPPPCSRCGRELELATIINALGDRPDVYVFKCSECERIAAYFLENGELRKW